MHQYHGVFIEHVPIRFDGGESSHHILIRSNSSVPGKIKSAITQARRITKEGLSAIGISSLAALRRNTRKNNGDDTAMTKDLEEFQSKLEHRFLSFAANQLDKDIDMIKAIKKY